MSYSRKLIWPREAEATLIEKVQSYPVLWDSSHELYAKKTYRRKQLQEVADYIMLQHPALILTADDVRQKFNNMKNYYVKEKKRQIQPSGSSGGSSSKWEWFKSLSFLDFVTTPGPSESNLCPEELQLYPEESQLCNEGTDSEGTCVFTFDASNIIGWDSGIHTTDLPDISTPATATSPRSISPAAAARPKSHSTSVSRPASPASPATSSYLSPPPKKKINKKKDEVTAAISVLNKVIDQDQDFAYGTGLQIVNGMRRMSFNVQLEFAGEALQLMKHYLPKNTE